MNLYYTCFFPEKRALEYGPVPETWANITGMSGLDDEALADLSWAGYPGYGFLKEDAAREHGITKESLASAYDVGCQVELGNVRDKRDHLLAASDVAVLADRWAGYTKAQRQSWTDYRAALRDLPSAVADPFNVTWPTVPGASTN